MASAKDTFEPNAFESNTFACGTFRGLGVTVVGDIVVFFNESTSPAFFTPESNSPAVFLCEATSPAVELTAD